MNFLLRPNQTAAAAADHPPAPARKTPPATLEGLIADDKSPLVVTSGEDSRDSFGGENGNLTSTSALNFAPLDDKHIDVKEDQGWITIPFKELPDDWGSAPDMHWFSPLDRSFVFPGEQVHIVACLSASKQDTEIITPFKVAAMMNKNGVGQSPKGQNGNVIDKESSSDAEQVEPNGQVDGKIEIRHQGDLSASESLRMEDYRRQTQTLLQRFKDSHFFVRIAESGEPLWSKRGAKEASEGVDDSGSTKGETAESGTSITAVIDSGRFDAQVSGGLARCSVKCSSLANGDIVVLLQVNVGVDALNEPVLEILQFEKHRDRDAMLESDMATNSAECNPYGELLKWLLPLDNSHNAVNRPRSPPLVNASHKQSLSASSGGSQLFSFGHFRSYSMSSLPQNVPPVSSPPVSIASSKPAFDLEDWERFASQKSTNNPKTGGQDLLSFRGVSLEPERFSVSCGLEGIYIPGRRWRKQLEIIQPVDIHTFAAYCNTDDLLCVQIKNVAPAHLPDIAVYIDAITIILEEASKSGPPLSVPLASIESGTNHSLPNLVLRRGEEHSFILKPATSVLKKSTTYNDKIIKPSRSKVGSRAASMRLPPKATVEGKRIITSSSSDKYAVLVSCRCNYSESRLFFKKPTDWRPRISRDLMISVASEISKQTLDLTSRVSRLPVQVLTLQASNLTSEDLTLTILAPASLTCPPSVLSLNSAPSSPSSFVGFPTTEKPSTVPRTAENQKENATQSLSFDEQAVSVADAIPTTALRCTHLWLHSKVPLGCVPSQSTATIKLELLPLTDGIITLDTLQINVKEKGQIYIPEHALKINATSSIATGIV